MDLAATGPSLATQWLDQSAPHVPNVARDVQDLVQRLSPEAEVHVNGTEGFEEALARWSTLQAPTFRMFVDPATEEDVVEIVRYANEENVPFLAISGGHGAITTVGKFDNGIGIRMTELNSIDIAEDGLSATFGGGSLTKAVVDTLWAAGKQTGKCQQSSFGTLVMMANLASQLPAFASVQASLDPALEAAMASFRDATAWFRTNSFR
jgi:hypothetical protein